ncbi:hypothetical protein V6Z92_001838 [Aspergillus fumigatus]
MVLLKDEYPVFVSVDMLRCEVLPDESHSQYIRVLFDKQLMVLEHNRQESASSDSSTDVISSEVEIRGRQPDNKKPTNSSVHAVRAPGSSSPGTVMFEFVHGRSASLKLASRHTWNVCWWNAKSPSRRWLGHPATALVVQIDTTPS